MDVKIDTTTLAIFKKSPNPYSTVLNVTPLYNSTGLMAPPSNITEKERMSYLEYLDTEKWPYIYPAIIFFLILMTLGIIGNSIVVVVYTKRFKPSMARFFILALATCDLLSCSLSIPGIIVELRYHYTFYIPVLCKIFRASRMDFVLVSFFILFIIAVDRYRKVCRTLKSQYSTRSARWSLLIINIVALCYTAYGAVVAGTRTVTTDREDVFGSNCAYDEDLACTPIVRFYSVLLFVTFAVCVGLLVVLYSLIGRHVWKHRRFMFTPAKCTRNTTKPTTYNYYRDSSDKYSVSVSTVSGSSAGTEINVIVTPFSDNSISRAAPTNETLSGGEDKSSKGCINQSEQNPASKQSIKYNQRSTLVGQKRSTGKTPFTLFIITLFFIVSFLPFLIMQVLWGYDWEFVNGLQGYNFTVYTIFYRSYHVNNVVNCFIYGFFNPRFRRECKQLLYSICKK